MNRKTLTRFVVFLSILAVPFLSLPITLQQVFLNHYPGDGLYSLSLQIILTHALKTILVLTLVHLAYAAVKICFENLLEYTKREFTSLYWIPLMALLSMAGYELYVLALSFLSRDHDGLNTVPDSLQWTRFDRLFRDLSSETVNHPTI
ncbi:MAG: hypothetical protein ABEJ65_06885 [bacterium]